MVRPTYKETLLGFVRDHAESGATVYSDDAAAYETLPFVHDSVKHSLPIPSSSRFHQRHRVTVVHVDEGSLGYVSQALGQAVGPLSSGVCRASLQSRSWPRQVTESDGQWDELEAAALRCSNDGHWPVAHGKAGVRLRWLDFRDGSQLSADKIRAILWTSHR